MSRYKVIDGQQRITSLFILYSVVVNRIVNDNYSINKLINDRDFYFNPINEDDKDYFQKILTETEIPEPMTISQKMMSDARKLFSKFIEEKEEEEAKEMFGKKVIDFPDYLMNKINFMVHLVTNEIDANKMFEAINNRGLGLNHFDKLKALFLLV